MDDALDTERLRDSPAAGVLESVDREAAADLRETLAEALAEDPPNTVTQGPTKWTLRLARVTFDHH